jgi:hypothetical protein
MKKFKKLFYIKPHLNTKREINPLQKKKNRACMYILIKNIPIRSLLTIKKPIKYFLNDKFILEIFNPKNSIL